MKLILNRSELHVWRRFLEALIRDYPLNELKQDALQYAGMSSIVRYYGKVAGAERKFFLGMKEEVTVSMEQDAALAFFWFTEYPSASTSGIEPYAKVLIVRIRGKIHQHYLA